MSIRKQCELLNLNGLSLYYQAKNIDERSLLLMRLIDEAFTQYPFYGSRRMTEYLRRLNHPVNRKRVQHLYRLMGLKTLYPKKNLSQRNKAPQFTDLLLAKNIKASMDGRGRALDNIFVERLWRSLKYECVYTMNFTSVQEATHHIKKYFLFYNHERLHQSLDYRTPAEVYFAK